MRYSVIYLAFSALFFLSSCDKFLDITPTGKVIAKTGEEYRALLTYEYKNFPEDRGFTTLRGDELTLSPATTKAEDYDAFFDVWSWNDEAPSQSTASPNWRRYWHIVYIANYIIEHKNEITNISPSNLDQLIGEAFMLRAYTHFLLANIFAPPYTKVNPSETRGIPVVTHADVNALPRCSSLQAVYNRILEDIYEAKKHLNVQTWEEGLNYRFSTVSADALLSRVLLYMGDWKGANDAAKAVLLKRNQLIDFNKTTNLLPNAYNSIENILALEQVMTNTYKNIGYPSASILALYNSGDLRRTVFYKRVTSSISTLLKGGSNAFACSFRTAEAYLVAAESDARLGNLDKSRSTLLLLVKHRLTPETFLAYEAKLNALNQSDLIDEIFNERARELAFEGFRWDDLRRGEQPSLVKTYKGETFSLQKGDARYTLRFPVEAVEANPELELWQ